MAYSMLFVKLVFFVCYLVGYSLSDVPDFVSGFGITVLSSTQLNPQLYEVILSSQEVRGNQTVRILIPPDYTTSAASRRYPVLYLLHGATQSATAWTVQGDAQNILGNQSLITVMPNADTYGFYTNWAVPGNSTPQNWRTYHMEQLVPWIDLNLRTVAKKEGRAIAGLSMGGYGSIHYAERYSGNFIYAASFSGAVDILDERLQDMILRVPTPDKTPFVGPFGYPNEPISSNAWFAEDTITHAAELRNMSVAIYTGRANSFEATLGDGSHRLQNVLSAMNIPVYFDDYGDGQSIGHGCEGTHTWPCWEATLIDVLPRMMAVLQQQS